MERVFEVGSVIEIPLKIVSVQNESSHWRAVARRRKDEKDEVFVQLKFVHKLPRPALPCVVRLTRIAPRPLDSHDNLRVGFKGPVDAIATWLDIKDADTRITWQYAQEKGKPKSYSIRIEFLATISSPTT